MRKLLLLFLLTGITSAQTNFFVSNSGNDSSNGTSLATPWATIAKCISSFTLGTAGAVCHVQTGTYPSGVNFTRGGSSPSVRFVLQCDQGTTNATAAIAKCKVTGTATGVSVAGGVSNIDLKGFDIGGNANMATGIFGIGGSTGSSFHILGNYIHDLASLASGPEGVGCPQTGAILTNNGAAHTDYQIIGNIIVRYGAFPSSSCFNAHAIYSAANSIIENNVLVGFPSAGIQVHSDFCNTVITNNTIINGQTAVLGEGAAGCTNDGQPVGKNTVNNNLSLNMSKWHFQNGVFNGGTPQCTPGTPNRWSNNITDDIVLDFSANYLASCDTKTPNPYTHSTGAALFVNYQTNGTGDYHLKAGSPAIRAGTTTCTTGVVTCVPATDLDGNIRPAPLSVGAYDITNAVIQPPTGLTATVN